MKLFVYFLFFISVNVFAQTYLISSYNGSSANCTDLSLLDKITFTDDKISFVLTDQTIIKDISSISSLTFSSTNLDNPLPVELAGFNYSGSKDGVVLKWNTVTEINNYGFEIERASLSEKLPKDEFIKIGFVEGCGNSNSIKEYSYIDKSVNSGNYYYRLKQINNSGNYSYSEPIEVKVEAYGIPAKFALLQNYPNPFNPSTNICYKLPKSGKVKLTLFTVLGEFVTTLVNDVQEAGVYNYNLTANNYSLSSGIYFCRLTASAYSSSIKMILTK